ncbi:hypothetical protein SPI_00185 [Niveomyces insectorum RCEF 264]|uniref:Uncharacterized protein n=1 Tax=Niveomyces insectorum RCEF 264 TaxID=1081102 RepID=A0A167ZWS6_9HYPO|nr:hypothetical protein SPI_00185 [Niveomyces insectorum RCEF 264]
MAIKDHWNRVTRKRDSSGATVAGESGESGESSTGTARHSTGGSDTPGTGNGFFTKALAWRPAKKSAGAGSEKCDRSLDSSGSGSGSSNNDYVDDDDNNHGATTKTSQTSAAAAAAPPRDGNDKADAADAWRRQQEQLNTFAIKFGSTRLRRGNSLDEISPGNSRRVSYETTEYD